MKNSLYKTLKADIRLLRINADKSLKDELTEILTEHYPMLDRCLRQSAAECRKLQKRLKDPKLLPGLFDKCRKMCHDGRLPDSDGIIGFLSGINGSELQYLPLAITIVLLHGCCEAITENDSEKLKSGVMSLQKIREIDFDYISEKLFSAEDILMCDPNGTYADVDCDSKARYRRKIASLAEKNSKSERETAKEILEKAKKDGRHIGEYLFTTVKNKKYGTVSVIAEALMPALVCAAFGILSGEWLVSLLLYFPVWEIMRYPEEKAVLARIVPRSLLSLDPECEKVSKVRAMIVLSVILPSSDKISEITDKLENLYLSNGGENTGVCCLGDFKAADVPRKAEDKHILNLLNKAIDGLNEKYGGGFVAAVRPRSYSETQNEFIGKERKRGAVRDLVRAVKGDCKGFLSLHGDTNNLFETKYFIALDYDSRPVFDSVRNLIAVAEHPVNKPVIKNGRVVSGYGILSVKNQTSLDCEKTLFGNIMSQNAGVSSYDEHSAERYQQLFGESVFCGKGLINVDAYFEVLDKTLPKERVLSHDVIEGELLRTGYVSGVQIIEEFPSSTDGYYKRQHRWVRGDWQNSGFIFGKNPMSFVSRYKLFDNLRRCITPVVCLGVIVYSAFLQGNIGIAAAAVSGLSLCSADIYAGVNSFLRLGLNSVTGLYYSKRLPDSLGFFVKAFVSVAYSAREAFICADASIRVLWRMLVSGDKLLEWTTSATQDNRDARRLSPSCLPALVVSSVLIVFGLPIHRLFGLIILTDIPITVFAEIPVLRRKKDVSESQKEYLLSQASFMWEYFDDLCGEDNNYLPPDNIQFAPHRAVAKRTSPTNIGLMLACFLAARDFGFITSEELCRRLNSSLDSIEKLEKYKGNLLNWYDISTLKTLSPRFVSAVDSGNYLCCLTAVKEGIREFENECSGLKKVSERIKEILDSTDLSVMYNSQRKLFHIGINPDSHEKTESCYDLYMSEIRMTAYYAAARKCVPKNHWGALDRPLIRSGRYAGLASWTGTMFEYFMADIFIPAPEGSLSNEALKFCFQRQRKKSGKNPFGMSESAFYAFDGDLNYQYKAHGVQKLGLKRGLDNENVISPYSSFLTLNIAPHLSLSNLKKLEKLGMTGRYGFYEAADYTRRRNNGSFSVVNSFMVHHVGMSFLAVDNLLNGKIMQNRFMQDRFMKGAETLLEEKPPQGKVVFKDIVTDTVIPGLRERINKKTGNWYTPDVDNPKISVFFNGRMTLCVSDSGKIQLYFDGEKIYPMKELSDFFECRKKEFNFCRSDMTVKTSENFVTFKTENQNTVMKMQLWLSGGNNCIIKKYTIENKSKKDIFEGRLKNCLPQHFRNGYCSSYGFINGNTEKKDGVCETEITVGAGEKKDIIFAFSIDTTEDEAVNSFERLKRKGEYKKADNPFFRESFLRALAEKHLYEIIKHEKKEIGCLNETFGITANYPVLLATLNSTEFADTARLMIVFNKIMRNCGIKNTLVLYLNLPKSEKNAGLETIEKLLYDESCNLMLGIGGGAYVFDGNFYKKTDFEKLKSASTVFIDG